MTGTLSSLAEGEDPSYDGLLRSLATSAQDHSRQVINFVVSWGQAQGDDVSVSHLGNGGGRYNDRTGEFVAILQERRTVSSMLVELTGRDADMRLISLPRGISSIVRS